MNESVERIPLWRHDAYATRMLQKNISAVANHLDNEQKTIVDLGAGSAPYKRLFTYRGHRYICCDLAGNESDVIIEPGQPIPIETGTADMVGSFQVLEHVLDVHLYLSESKRILRKNGMLLISTHGTWPYHPHPHDYRRWTKEGLEAELGLSGFKVKQMWSHVGPLAWMSLFGLFGVTIFINKIPIIGHLISSMLCTIYYPWLIFLDWITPEALKHNNAAIYVSLAVPTFGSDYEQL